MNTLFFTLFLFSFLSDMERWLVCSQPIPGQEGWRSASCHPVAALRSRGGPSTQGEWLVPRARKKSVPLSSRACIVRATPRPHTTDTIMSRPIQHPMTRRNTTRRRTSLRRRRNAVRWAHSRIYIFKLNVKTYLLKIMYLTKNYLISLVVLVTFCIMYNDVLMFYNVIALDNRIFN